MHFVTSMLMASLAVAGLGFAANARADDQITYFSGVDYKSDFSPAVDAICRNDSLIFLDIKIAQRYSETYARAEGQGKLRVKADQQHFLVSRNACGSDVACLTNVLKRRVQTIGHYRWS